MNLDERNREDARLRSEHKEMLAALKGVLAAYKGYGCLACRDSEEYISLTAVRRAIKNAQRPHSVDAMH